MTIEQYSYDDHGNLSNFDNYDQLLDNVNNNIYVYDELYENEYIFDNLSLFSDRGEEYFYEHVNDIFVNLESKYNHTYYPEITFYIQPDGSEIEMIEIGETRKYRFTKLSEFDFNNDSDFAKLSDAAKMYFVSELNKLISETLEFQQTLVLDTWNNETWFRNAFGSELFEYMDIYVNPKQNRIVSYKFHGKKFELY